MEWRDRVPTCGRCHVRERVLHDGRVSANQQLGHGAIHKRSFGLEQGKCVSSK